VSSHGWPEEAPPGRELRTAGIVGVNWGVVHLYNLRSAGVRVVALCATDLAKAGALAAEHGVEHATTDVAELEGLDVVVIATPVETHAGLLRRFESTNVICEKPVFGRLLREGEHLPASRSTFVNYAFGFLDAARALEGRVAEFGTLRAVRLTSRAALPGGWGPARWFLETASHPLAWILLRGGEPRVIERTVRAHGIELRLVVDGAFGLDTLGTEVVVEFRLGGDPGIHHEVRVEGDRRVASFDGGFRPGHPWRFSPVWLDGRAISPPEESPEDPWLRANARSVEAMLSAFRGGVEASDAAPLGLFDVARALRIERALFDAPANAVPSNPDRGGEDRGADGERSRRSGTDC